MNHFRHLAFNYPQRLFHIRGFQSFYPLVTSMSGVFTSGLGGGGGFADNSIITAYGEFIERQHFHLDIVSHLQGKMHECNPLYFAEPFYEMITQVQKSKESVTEHDFKLTKVKNLFTEEDAFIPTVLLSLQYFDKSDRQFIPFVDSCGEAAHNQKERAILSSLNEFIERQNLVASWSSKTVHTKIEPDVLLSIPHYQKTAKKFLENGEVHVFEISRQLPGFTIMTLYFARCPNDRVQFCIGLASHFDPIEALRKSLNELWLDYIYMYFSKSIWQNQNDDKPRGMQYKILHMEDNNCEKTKSQIPYDLSESIHMTAKEYLSHKPFTLDKALSQIQNISPNVFLYHVMDSRGDYHYTKIFSPDFFLHMAVEEPLNIKNRYSKQLDLDLKNLYLQRIPFP